MQRSIVLHFLLAVCLMSGALALDDVQILPTRVDLESAKEKSKSNMTVTSKAIAYSVKVTSRAFKELTNVTVKYNIFYQVSDLGSTAEPETKVGTGSHVFPSLLTNKPVEFQTEPIKLEKGALDAGWHFDSGASSKTKDKVVGLWFKVFDSTGKQIGEYINPSTIAKKQKWKD